MKDDSRIDVRDAAQSPRQRQVNDIADYLCSRGDTMHLRDEVKERAHMMLNGLEMKGWMIVRKPD